MKVRLSVDCLGSSIGQATNLMSNDTQRLYEMQLFLHYLWLAPSFIITVVVLMYIEIGVAAFIGFGVLFLMLPMMVSLRSLGLQLTIDRTLVARALVKQSRRCCWKQTQELN